MQSKIKMIYTKIIERDTIFWKRTIYGLLFIAALALVGISLGMPTGIGIWFDIPVFTMIGLLFIILISHVAAALLTLMRLSLPRLFISYLLCVYCTLSITLTQFNINYAGSAFLTSFIVLIGFLLGSSYSLMMRKRRSWLVMAYGGMATIIFVYGFVWLLGPGKGHYESIRPEDSAYMPVRSPVLTDPSQEGNYTFSMFTYGSGEDLHRIEFSEDIDFITPSVDASRFLTEWHPLRSLYWGFDESEIPLEGRVWMPEGKGRFPLVLIVHGSNKMEKFSDEGYDYLGELLASRGFIAVSVGQSFINYSVWSQGIDWDMTTRAWVLLQHLIMIEEANKLAETPFYNKVDMENLAIVGHSRGGQAAALAASFSDFYHDNHHPEISLDVNFKIKAVAAIAPTDRLIEDRFIRLRDVDYFVLQGSHDSDVNIFYGDRQYRRTDLTYGQGGFKASLYVEGASHGEFNTVWGDQDTTMPTALLLNKRELLPGDTQRHIAKVMITAFLEASLHDQRDYLAVLKDYRAARDWLPETTYINRFEDDTFITVSDYEEDKERSTTTVYGGTIYGQHLRTWREQDIKYRTGHSAINQAVYLAWDGRREAVYGLTLPDKFAVQKQLTAASELVFSLANADLKRLNPYKRVPKISIALETKEGHVIQFPLSAYGSYPPIIHSRFTKLGIFERTVKFGNLGDSAEPVFQSYHLPLAEIMAEYGQFDPSQMKEIRFILEKGTSGKLYIDDIGFKHY